MRKKLKQIEELGKIEELKQIEGTRPKCEDACMMGLECTT
jgi:hypothetical protein